MYKNCPMIVAVVGFVVLLIGIICSWYAFPKLVDHEISKNLAMEEGNDVFKIWKKQPFPLKFRAFFFNVTNPSEVQMGDKPMFKEVGPYVFDEYWEKVKVSINETEDTIEYYMKKTFYYNEKETACRSADDVVTIINSGLVIAAIQAYTLMPSALSMVNDAVPYLYKGIKDVFIRASVRDILFEGILITCHDPEIDFICGAMKGMLPPNVKTTNNGQDIKFSLFGAINTTLLGPFVMGRGMKDKVRGDLVSVLGLPEIEAWSGPTCNMINGTDSTIFRPLKTPPERIYVFAPEICRSVHLNYEKDFEYEGISTWKYATRPEAFGDTGIDNCFCPKGQNEKFEEIAVCPPKGLLNTVPCTKAPLLVSNPHFYLADPALLEYAQGLKPKKKMHESLMYFEPITGNPVYGARRMQMNVELRRFEDITVMANVSEGIFPMMWIEEIAFIPPQYRNQLTDAIKQLRMLDIFKWIIIVLGILIMLSSFVLVMYKEKLLCFANGSSKKLGVIDVTSTNNKPGIVEPAPNVNFNNTVLYPSLYPQIYDKNVNDKLVRRNNFNPHPKNGWQFNN